MVKVLAIGDLSNNIVMFKKFTKSPIHLLNFSWDGPSKVMDIREDVEFFNTSKTKEIIKKINSVKDKYDICIAMSSTGLLMAYLADLNYIAYFVGHDIRSPPFLKNVKDPLSTDEPLYHFNFLERWLYKKAYDNAIACVVTDDELLSHLQRYRKDPIRITGYIVDTTIFNENIKPIQREKTKFTFFSPARMGLQKGTDKIWEALRLCKTDFEVIQIEWYDKRTPKEIELARNWIENKPPQVKFVPIMKREDVGRYMVFADAVLGQVSGIQADVERSGALCKKPVIHYADPKITYIVQGKRIPSPFLPHSNDPKTIAETIDRIVEDKEFREKLAKEEHEFVMGLSDPKMIAEQWDKLFEDMAKRYGSIRKNSHFVKIRFIMLLFLIGNRLYLKKIKKIFKL
jgi:glycosyltransferase involved in cell wall biosynthesis